MGDVQVGCAHGADPLDCGTAHRLLGQFFALAVEVYCGVGGGTAVGAATDRAWVLYSGCDRSAQPLGRFYNELVGHPLPFTFEGLLLASILYSLPFAVQPFAAAFEQVDRRLIEASWTLGVSKLNTFFKLIMPLSKAGLVTGAVLSFAHTMGEFGVVLMVGGNLEGETRTVSIDIYDEVQALNYAGAAKTALFLLVVSYAVLLLVYAVNRNVWAAWPQK